jgi:hypothetical protein
MMLCLPLLCANAFGCGVADRLLDDILELAADLNDCDVDKDDGEIEEIDCD